MTQNEKTDYKESDVLAILKETEAFFYKVIFFVIFWVAF